MSPFPRSLLVTSILIAAFACLDVEAQYKPEVAPSPSPPSTVAALYSDPATELLHSSKVKLTRGDYDAQLSKLPAETRDGFGTNIDRINTLLRVILVDKTLADEARSDGIDRDPEIQRRIAAESDRILAQAVMQRYQAGWEKEFDARPGLDAAARERWLATPDRYREPEQYQTTQIRFAFDRNGGAEGAKEKAADARRRILAGGDMTAIAKSESDDPAAVQTGGKLDWRTLRGFDDAAVGRTVSNLRNPGELSRPIETDGAVYLIRLDAKRAGEKRSFDDVKASILADLRKEYVSTMMNQKMASIRNDATIVVNQPAVEALVTRIDPAYLTPKLPNPGSRPSPGPGRARPATQ